MALDAVRNKTYEQALRRFVGPGTVVMDLGAGLGIHGLMAARLGARKVFLVDPSPVIAMAGEIAKLNGLSDRVEVIRARIEEAELPSKVDLIVSVFTGNFLLTEDLLPVLFHARDRYLQPGGQMIPGRARMRVAPVTSPRFFDEQVGCWSSAPFGIDFSPNRAVAANTVHYAYAREIEAEPLAEAATLLELDLASANSAACRVDVVLETSRQGTCHGLLGWFDIQLGQEWLSTGPRSQPTHWRLAFLPLDPPLDVDKGDLLSVRLDRPEFGEWTWSVACGPETRRHSTFLAGRADLDFLKTQSDSFVPGLGPEGQLAQFVLRRMSEGHTTREVLEAVAEQFGGRFRLAGQLERRVRQLISTWKNGGTK